MAMKQAKGHNSFATPEKSYEDMDCVKIEVAADQVSIEKPAGMLERVRQTLFGSSPEPNDMHIIEEQSQGHTEDSRSVQLSMASNCSQMSTPEKHGKKRSVLDELESYWEEHDKISASSEKIGIKRLQVDDMMLDDMMLLKPGGKRQGAFCIGI